MNKHLKTVSNHIPVVIMNCIEDINLLNLL